MPQPPAQLLKEHGEQKGQVAGFLISALGMKPGAPRRKKAGKTRAWHNWAGEHFHEKLFQVEKKHGWV
jgi:hypothetical protein